MLAAYPPDNSARIPNVNGLLEIRAKDYYYDTLRKEMLDLGLKAKEDEELLRTMDEVTNHVDSLFVRDNLSFREKNDIIETFDPLVNMVNDRYFTRKEVQMMQPESVQAIRDMIAKVGEFMTILRVEDTIEPEDDSEPKRSVPYKESPNGVINSGKNEGYDEHNMEILNKIEEKKRLPNI